MVNKNYHAFLGKDDVRSFLNLPFLTAHGDAYCNGHILVLDYSASAPERSDPPETVTKKAEEIFAECADPSVEWFDCPEIPREKFVCSACNGSGISTVCEECEGRGWIEFENDFHEYVVGCKSCESETSHECSHCMGGLGGKKAPYFEAALRGRPVTPHYINLIKNVLSGSMIALSADEKMILIRFDGGCGALMTRTEASGSFELCQPKAPLAG